MAPVRPRRSTQSKTTLSPKMVKPTIAKADDAEDFTRTPSKRDKRLMKHSVLVSKARASARVTKPSIKKRRPAKKLKAAQNLDELVASLPDVSAAPHEEPRSSKERRPPASAGLVSKPGVQRRRDRIAQSERARFSKNLALMNAHPKPPPSQEEQSAQQDNTSSPNSSHWAALRQHISETLKG